MSLQWTLVAGVLYVEMFIVLLLLIPFISPKRWYGLSQTRLLRLISPYSKVYVSVIVVGLLVLLFDAIREVRKYGGVKDYELLHSIPSADAVTHLRLFRAQRNLYITLFALFLSVVTRRLFSLLCREGEKLAAEDRKDR